MIDLEFNQVSKRYRVRRPVIDDGAGGRHPLVRRLQALRSRSEDFWAVRDVTFEVRRGEALGIIGHNGAGKSTILKLLSNITAPTKGEIRIRGRLAALIEVGSGFHPELTGRENIFLNGSILGMRRREIAAKLESIVEFAGVRQFIDTPVKRYSSGMYVRLGFSIAAHLDPDILLLDEVLAVGDAAFQQKCIARIRELKQAGTTIVFISHDLGAVERLCDRVLLMKRGQVITGGGPTATIAEYQRQSAAAVASGSERVGTSDKRAAVTQVTFHDAAGAEQAAFHTGGALRARLHYNAHAALDDVVFELFFYSGDGELLCQLTTELSGPVINLKPGAGAIEFACEEIGLRPAIHYVDATLKKRGALEDIDWQRHCATLRVDPGKVTRGRFYMPHEWREVTEGARLQAIKDNLSGQPLGLDESEEGVPVNARGGTGI
jgi:ABC-type polysaccharide/polyol phosphate transport system ATPase subunit